MSKLNGIYIKWISIAIVLVGVFVAYGEWRGRTTSQVNQNTEDIADHKIFVEPVVKELEISVPQIVQDVEYLQRDVTEIKQDVKDILTELRKRR